MAEEKAQITRDRLSKAIALVRTILSDEDFLTLLRSQGVRSLPARLTTVVGQPCNCSLVEAGTQDCVNDHSLDFVVGWSFLFPLFSNLTIAAHLEASWPGVVMEFKDTFIALVVDGPFPERR